MRKPRGKLVALLAGVAAVPVLVVLTPFWRIVYCHLFLDPRLVGHWGRESYVRGEPTFLEFDRIGNVSVVYLFLPHRGPSTETRDVHAYRIDKGAFLLLDDTKWGYEVEGDTLTVDRAGDSFIYRRLLDDP